MKHLPVVFALLLVPIQAFAAEAEASPGLFTAWLKLLAGLAVVLGLLYLFYALSRKGMLSFLPGVREGAIKIVEVKSLGPKKGLCLVQVRGQELLLGFGSERIDCLANLGPVRAEESFADKLEVAQGVKQA